MYHDCRWLQPVCTHTCEQNYSITHNHSGFLACVCVHVHTKRCSHDGDTLRSCPAVCRFPVYPQTSRISPSCSKTSISFYYALPPCVNESLPVTKNLLLLSLSLSPFFHFCMQQSNLNSTHWRFLVCVCVFRGWIVSLPCPIPFVSQMEKWAPLFVPGVLWLRTTSGFVWREGQKQRGREKEEVGNPPRPPNPPLPPSYWPLSIVPAGLLWALSPNQSGYQKGQRSLVAFYGP